MKAKYTLGDNLVKLFDIRFKMMNPKILSESVLQSLVYPLYGMPRPVGETRIFLYPVSALPKLKLADPEQVSIPVHVTMRSIYNEHFQKILGSLPPGLEGILEYRHKYQSVKQAVLNPICHPGRPGYDWVFWVVDYVNPPEDSRSRKRMCTTLQDRLTALAKLLPTLPEWVKMPDIVTLNNVNEMYDQIQKWRREQHEKIWLARPHTYYKFGASTWCEMARMEINTDNACKVFLRQLRNRTKAKLCRTEISPEPRGV